MQRTCALSGSCNLLLVCKTWLTRKLADVPLGRQVRHVARVCREAQRQKDMLNSLRLRDRFEGRRAQPHASPRCRNTGCMRAAQSSCCAACLEKSSEIVHFRLTGCEVEEEGALVVL